MSLIELLSPQIIILLCLCSFHLDHCGALPWFLEKVCLCYVQYLLRARCIHSHAYGPILMHMVPFSCIWSVIIAGLKLPGDQGSKVRVQHANIRAHDVCVFFISLYWCYWVSGVG